MNIAVTFRHMDATDAVKGYATERSRGCRSFLRAPMKSQVTLSCQQDRLHSVEVEIHSGPAHFHAHETSEDMYASIDKVIDKIERQIVSAKEAVAGQEEGRRARLAAAAARRGRGVAAAGSRRGPRGARRQGANRAAQQDMPQSDQGRLMSLATSPMRLSEFSPKGEWPSTTTAPVARSTRPGPSTSSPGCSRPGRAPIPRSSSGCSPSASSCNPRVPIR